MDKRRKTNKYLNKLKCGIDCRAEFFRYIVGYMEYVAYKFLADKSYVQDVIVQAFAKVLQNVHTFDDRMSGYAWVCEITKNEALKIDRKTERYKEDLPLMEEIVSTEDRELHSTEQYDLELAMEKLEPTDREIVEMKAIYDYTYAEIAQKFNLTPSAVYKRYKKSLKILLEFLK